MDTSCFAITSTSLSQGKLGSAYSAQLAANSSNTLSWSVASGVLPPGLALATDGTVSGIPTTDGAFAFTVSAIDMATGETDTQVINVSVAAIVIQVTAGYGHSCALKNNGKVFCWGENDSGQLGNGSFDERSLSPVAVTGITTAKSIAASAGSKTTCAVLDGGTAACWGAGHESTPVGISGLAGVVSVTTDTAQSCAALTDGSVTCWGLRAAGDGASNVVYPTPTALGGFSGAVSLVTGGYNGCALLTNSAQCWGNNYYGNLGDGSDGSLTGAPVTPTGFTSGVTRIAGSSRLSCGILFGDVYCWGDNYYNEAGPNCSTTRCRSPVAVTSGGAIAEVAVGDSTACMIDASMRHVSCWGSNLDRDSWLIGALLGHPSITSSASPLSIWTDDSDRAAQVALGSGHGCLVTESGLVYCWGENNGGQLGPASTLYASSTLPLNVAL